MGQIISYELHDCSLVMYSDVDRPVVMSICAGFNSRDMLTVSINSIDTYDRGRNCSTAAVVDTDDARQMARNNGVAYHDLPRFITDCMASWHSDDGKDNTHGTVIACFKQITECLLDEGCRFKIRRTTGRNGRVCC